MKSISRVNELEICSPKPLFPLQIPILNCSSYTSIFRRGYSPNNPDSTLLLPYHNSFLNPMNQEDVVPYSRIRGRKAYFASRAVAIVRNSSKQEESGIV